MGMNFVGNPCSLLRNSIDDNLRMKDQNSNLNLFISNLIDRRSIMNILHLAAPPIPFYIASGNNHFAPGQRHVSRKRIRVFDLLYVQTGCLHIGEEDLRFTVRAGEALILLPDRHHFGSQDCTEETRYHWLHFATQGAWHVTKKESAYPDQTENRAALSPEFDAHPFYIRLPQQATDVPTAKLENPLVQLRQLAPQAHLADTPFKQQMLFQQILLLLSSSHDRDKLSSSTQCAEKAASYLRMHFREPITAALLGEALNFHPVYIARCMHREYGCSPMGYLQRYRVEQSKLMLMQTGASIARVAEEVGFHSPPYFSSIFCKLEGLTPSQYRKQFS